MHYDNDHELTILPNLSSTKKLSDADVIPIFDVIEEVNNVESAQEYGYKINRSGKSDYSELIRTIKEQF